MSKPIFEIIDELPRRSLTVGLLQSLDWVVPGKYVNLVGFEETIQAITGETDVDYIQRVGVRAIELYNDTSQGYQRGLWIYQAADSVQGFAGAASFIEKVSGSFSFLSWLGALTPKAETTQSIDLAVKLVAEVLAFLTINGKPGDSLGEFIESITDYRDEARMRLATMICVDGVLPLGPNFLSKAINYVGGNPDQVKGNERFQRISGLIPGDGVKNQIGYLQKSLETLTDFVPKFVAENRITQGRVLESVKRISDKYEGSLDYIASVLDMTTDYFEHTGTQTVARQLITRAVSEI
jgi:hypothetical protein